ncbi:hypothetical protein SAMN05660473_00716 [Arthrobacter sp. 49Tsu3.1M3]|nr:hypothetical protein SAMN05660473_00716 [Arthrobacter sp. 49Tsu3.1M3]
MPLTGPALLNFNALKRVINLNARRPVPSIRRQPPKHVLALAAGPHFRGVIGVLQREAYAGPDGAAPTICSIHESISSP